MLKRFLKNPAPWWAIVLALGLGVPVGAANAVIFYGAIQLQPYSGGYPPNSSVKIINDNASINGMVLNVPSGSTNGWLFQVNGVATGQLQTNGNWTIGGQNSAQSYRNSNASWSVSSGGNETVNSITANGSTIGGVTLSSGSITGASLNVGGGSVNGGAATLNSLTASGIVSGSQVAASLTNPAFYFANSLGGEYLTGIGENPAVSCSGVNASEFYISAFGIQTDITGDGSGDVGVCGGLFANTITGSGAGITNLTCAQVSSCGQAPASGSCSIANGANDCVASLSYNMGSTNYACALTSSYPLPANIPSTSPVNTVSVTVYLYTNNAGSTVTMQVRCYP